MNTLKKEILKVLGVGVTGIVVLGTASYAASGTVTASSVRIREDASSSSSVISVATEGEKVEVIGEKDGWYNVNFEDVTGYIKLDYVKTDYTSGSSEEEPEESEDEDSTSEETTTEPNTSDENTVASSTDEVIPNEGVSETENTSEYVKNSTIKLEAEITLRSLPSFSSKTTSSIANGTEVTVKDELNHWIKITDGNVSGWVLKVDVAGDVSVVETTTEPDENTETNTEPDITGGTSTTETSTSSSTSSTSVSNSSTSSDSKKGYINVDGARVRTSPNGAVLDVLDKDTEVEILGEDDDWYIINYNGDKCYVSQKLITIK